MKESKRNTRIVQINVEGLTKSKTEIIGNMFKNADVLTLQETHIPEDKSKQLQISGFHLIDFIGHNKHGIATFVNEQVDQRLVTRVEGNDSSIGIKVENLTIFNVYKPPSCNWSDITLPNCQHPGIFIGDFNSHGTEWGYSVED
jgi:exonuclease III